MLGDQEQHRDSRTLRQTKATRLSTPSCHCCYFYWLFHYSSLLQWFRTLFINSSITCVGITPGRYYLHTPGMVDPGGALGDRPACDRPVAASCRQHRVQHGAGEDSFFGGERSYEGLDIWLYRSTSRITKPALMVDCCSVLLATPCYLAFNPCPKATSSSPVVELQQV
jgi:hypothetical protein